MGQYLESALLSAAGAAPASLGERPFDFHLSSFCDLRADRRLTEDHDGYRTTRNGWIVRTRRNPQAERRDRRSRRRSPPLGSRSDRSRQLDSVLPDRGGRRVAQLISSIGSMSPACSSRAARGRRGGSAFLWIWRTVM